MKKPTTRKQRRKGNTDSDSDSDTTPPSSPVHKSKTSSRSGTISAESGETSKAPGTIATKREKLEEATGSTEPGKPGKTESGKESEPTLMSDPVADTKAFNDDPAPFLDAHDVSFVGINWGSLPAAKDSLLFHLKSQEPKPTGDLKKDDLFVVTRDSRYVLNAEFPAATFRPQYDGTMPLTLAISDGGPDNGVRFLKWQENRLTAMFLDEDASLVFTGPLQGCHVYVADVGGGDLVLIHANANSVGDEAANEKVKDVKAETFLAPLKGRLIHRLARKDYAPTSEIAYNAFVFGRKNPDKTWTFSFYVIYINAANKVTGHRLEDLPLPP